MGGSSKRRNSPVCGRGFISRRVGARPRADTGTGTRPVGTGNSAVDAPPRLRRAEAIPWRARQSERYADPEHPADTASAPTGNHAATDPTAQAPVTSRGTGHGAQSAISPRYRCRQGSRGKRDSLGVRRVPNDPGHGPAGAPAASVLSGPGCARPIRWNSADSAGTGVHAGGRGPTAAACSSPG